MDMTDTNNNWTIVGLDQLDVKTICIIDSLNLIVGIDSENDRIYKTSDGGETWIPYTNGYGNGSDIIPLDIKSVDNAGKVLISSSQGSIIKSTNSGQSWDNVWTDNSTETNVNFIKMDPNNNDILWAGGQSTNGSPLILKSINQGNNWERVHVYRNDTTSINICHNLVFHTEIQGKILLFYTNMIKETSNNGISWITSYSLGPDYIADYLEIDSSMPGNLYFVSRSVTENFLNMFISNNAGVNWISLIDSTYDNHMTHDMVVKNIGDSNIIYLATENGILKYIDTGISIYQ
jgi:photosystem II stability/assembly factor-like uncharacterized protein